MASVSKSVQDAALLHVFSGIPDILLYSDNILVLSKTKQAHLDVIKSVFRRLRSHGLRLKPNKTSLFVTDRIKLYGVVVCLKSGKISPEVSKIEALRNRKIPQTRKEMKSFLGALVFFSQIAPIAVESIRILHKSTRGDFILTRKFCKHMKVFKLLCTRIIYSSPIDQTTLVNFTCHVILPIFTRPG